jgi:hypothetical protein
MAESVNIPKYCINHKLENLIKKRNVNKTKIN